MAEVVDIAGFKKRKLAKFEAEWDQCMSRAEKFQQEGKLKFAEEMLAKAKVLRVEITKLRGPEPKRPFLNMRQANPDIKFNMTFQGLSGVDLGYPKTTPNPLTPPE